MRLLEEVVRHPGGCTVNHLVAALELKTPTVFSLARTLVDAGYLEKTTGRPVRFLSGHRLHQLANTVADQGTDPVADTLERVARQFPGWRVIFCRAVGVDVFCERTVSLEADALDVSLAPKWLPPYVSASSLCHLAYWPEPIQRAFSEKYPFTYYALGCWTPETFDAEILQIQATGRCVITDREPARASVPLYDRRGAFSGNLGASVQAGNQSEAEAIAGALADAASTLVISRPDSRGALAPSAPVLASA